MASNLSINFQDQAEGYHVDSTALAFGGNVAHANSVAIETTHDLAAKLTNDGAMA